MASRLFNQESLTYELAVVKLYAVISIGATGAPTLSRGKGITSVSRTSAGLYVINLDDTYAALLGTSVIVLTTSGAVDLEVGLLSETVATTKTVNIQMVDLDGTPSLQDPADGDKLYVEITLSNSGQ